MDEKFKKASDDIKKIKELDNDNLLYLYGLYKQVTCGNCNVQKPSFIDIKGCAKWNAWEDRKDISKEKAQKKYIERVEKILSKK
jgi:diazepam-binding inhibitor (GABA receptor modulating acyl-CoA-binding protein)